MVVTTPAARRSPAANEMMFLYADGRSPVAHVNATVVALGQNSNTGRQTVPGSPLLNDSELGTLITGGLGEIALDDPSLKDGYESVAMLVKMAHPALVGWSGVPGQPTPLFRGGVNPSPGLAYPNVPVIVELFEPAYRPSKLPYRMATGTVVTSWQRPPIAQLDRQFYDPAEFLEALTSQYAFLSSRRLPLAVKLTRMGAIGSAPALEPALQELAQQYGRGKAFPRGPSPLQKIAQQVAAQLVGVLPISAASDLRVVYRDALREIARLAAANPFNLPTGAGSVVGPAEALTVAVLRAFGATTVDSPAVWTPDEDWAALGAAVFLAGVVPFGYRSGSVTVGTDPSTWTYRAALHQP